MDAMESNATEMLDNLVEMAESLQSTQKTSDENMDQFFLLVMGFVIFCKYPLVSSILVQLRCQKYTFLLTYRGTYMYAIYFFPYYSPMLTSQSHYVMHVMHVGCIVFNIGTSVNNVDVESRRIVVTDVMHTQRRQNKMTLFRRPKSLPDPPPKRNLYSVKNCKMMN